MDTFDSHSLDRDYIFLQDNHLKQLSQDDLVQLLDDYYNSDNKVVDILSRHHLSMRPGDLSRELPYIKIEERCPYDNSRLLEQIPSKTRTQNWLNNKICRQCGHTVYYQTNYLCDCFGCQEKRSEFRDDLAKMGTKISKQKKDYQKLSLESKVDLSAFIKMDNNPFGYRKVGVTHKNTDTGFLITESLKEQKLIYPSRDNDPEDFDKIDFKSMSYRGNWEEINWELNIKVLNYDYRQTLDTVEYMMLNQDLDDFEVESLYRKIAIESLTNYFLYSTEFLSYATPSKETVQQVVQELLSEYTPEMFLETILSTLHNYDLLAKNREKLFEKKGFMNLVQNEIKKTKKSKGTGRPAEKRSIEAAELLSDPKADAFFENVVDDPAWMGKMIPAENDSAQKLPAHELEAMIDYVEDDISIIPEELAGAKSYSITEHGILVNYKLGTIMYSDQLSLYKLAKEKNLLSEGSDWWSTNGFNFTVEKFYSLKFLLELAKTLTNSNIKQK
ncbi:hypothetical protein [Companilactobacillus sp.]|jgi:hypothetical protein|uniref:hypothetical protein n=1 Tax=Companilactobacillus sp. TaxID=2767905 RepID=UPI0025C3DEDF|nr:hypothetical protein [Companilactobacillus sp.]MCH4009989.1 hypothetical protein [Companilactobacillus sp.]MCH4052335.1 hypothetical protein [Companilactobacillus sp.]MCH4077931.1 hypothetical protein [Companilactobacillus sp.]MCH4126507.1 hypothetical protein [Companilactobacillus sp.]MCH4132093.1 hypothetical protein [Companilactobacillus sp.]